MSNEHHMNPEFLFHLRSLSRFIYFVTEEEDTFIVKLQKVLGKKYAERAFVFNAALGLVPLNQLIQDWSNRNHTASSSARDIHDALIQMYKDDPRDEQNFYVITDPDRWLKDPHIQRRFLNVAHQMHQDDRTIKITIFVGPRLHVPQKLQRYIEVVHDKGMTSDEIEEKLGSITKSLKMKQSVSSVSRHFQGLIDYEVNAAVAQSIIRTKEQGEQKKIDPRIVGEYKRRQLAKTDLISYVDSPGDTFNVLGGCEAFKEWAEITKASWTDEGRKFGLRPPKGVLLVGVWGCGKSLSVKALGNAWRLPIVQLEMGKLRSSGVGESEANVYRAIGLVEAVAPCLIWIDEAEKSLAGNQSSARSDAGTTARTIGILSTWLQETDAPVCLAMTANALSTLPVEFVNRMDERFFFDLPAEDERADILEIHLNKRGQDPMKFQLAELAEAAKNMVGREIEQAIGAALTKSFHAGTAALDAKILLTEITSKPRIFKTMVDELKEVLDWVGYDPDVDDGIRARFASKTRSETFKQFKGKDSD